MAVIVLPWAYRLVQRLRLEDLDVVDNTQTAHLVGHVDAVARRDALLFPRCGSDDAEAVGGCQILILGKANEETFDYNAESPAVNFRVGSKGGLNSTYEPVSSALGRGDSPKVTMYHVAAWKTACGYGNIDFDSRVYRIHNLPQSMTIVCRVFVLGDKIPLYNLRSVGFGGLPMQWSIQMAGGQWSPISR